MFKSKRLSGNRPLAAVGAAAAGVGSFEVLFWPSGWGRGWGGLRTCSSFSSSSWALVGVGGWGLSAVTLTGRRFPGSSAPGDLSSLGVGGRPAVFCGGLCTGRKSSNCTVAAKIRANAVFALVLLALPPPNNPDLQSVTNLLMFLIKWAVIEAVLLPARRGCCRFAVLLAWRGGAFLGWQSQNGGKWQWQVAPWLPDIVTVLSLLVQGDGGETNYYSNREGFLFHSGDR